MKRVIGSILLLLCSAQITFSQQQISKDNPDATLKSHVDHLAGTLIDADGPGFSVVVVREQKIMLRAAYGMANLEQGAALTTESQMHIGSISKHFTAWAILLLEQRGLLSTADDIRMYLPELPDYGKPITISHLLYHTSGLPEYLRLFTYAGIFSNDRRRFEDVYEMLKHGAPGSFPPGTQWQYSNTNYALLAEIVQRRTGKDFDTWLRENLLRPLGMNHTLVPTSNDQVVRNMAESYWRRNGPFEKYMIAESIPGPTLVCTTPADMANWMMNFRNNTIGGKDLFEKLCSKGTLDDGQEIWYSMGIARGDYRGVATLGHSGEHGGFVAEMTYCPEIDLGIAVMGNFIEFKPNRVRNAILDFLVFHDTGEKADKNTMPAGEPRITGKPLIDQLKFVGNYRVEGTEDIASLFVDRGSLWGNYLGVGNVELFPVDERTVSSSGRDITIRILDSSAGTAELDLKGTHLKVARIPSSQLEPEKIDAVVGRYYSDVLDAVYSIVRDNGRLLLKQRRSVGTHELAYAGKNTLVCSLGELRMTFDDGGRGIGFTLWHETVNSIPFMKIGS